MSPRYRNTPLAHIVNTLADGQTVWGCRQCDWTFTNDGEPIEHRCGRSQVTRLGDRIELALMAAGVTEQRWRDVKEQIGFPPTCNCASRKQWLNALDQRLGLGEKMTAFTTAIGWSK